MCREKPSDAGDAASQFPVRFTYKGLMAGCAFNAVV
jgi:hypothetical protein